MLGEAVRRLVGEGRVDHVDLNFGCPAPKVTRRGGGAALPVKRALLRAIVRPCVAAAAPAGVPVTMKFRMGVDDRTLTFLDDGPHRRGRGRRGDRAARPHGRAALLRPRPTGPPSAELKEAVTTVPVLGNGDIWEAADALAMVAATGCDGVVVGRGCLGRPWLFADLEAAFAGKEPAPPPRLGEVGDRHGRPRPAARRLGSARAPRCGTSASTPAGTSPATRAGRRSGAGWPWSRPWPSSTTCWPASTPTSSWCRAACASIGATPTAPARSTCPHGWLDDPDDAHAPARRRPTPWSSGGR